MDVGMVRELWIMYAAVAISVLIMLIEADPICRFIQKHRADPDARC
jgi:predicted tellurium resistance membrane protein TerC